jgi:UPF0271 protein
MIDLNCDLGEDPSAAGVALDAALCEVVTSINVACGGHAGDAMSMSRLARAARERGLALGAHPSFPDRAGFGRTELAIDSDTLEDSLRTQLLALGTAASREGATISHIKAHGALYHATMRDAAHTNDAHADSQGDAQGSTQGTARALLSAITSIAGCAGFAASPRVVVQAGPLGDALEACCIASSLEVSREAFADRAYEPGGALRARSLPGALIDDADRAAAQAVEIALHERVTLADGSSLAMHADTLCVHSDSPHALEIARAVRAALEKADMIRA